MIIPDVRVQCYLFMNSKHHKSDAFQVAFSCGKLMCADERWGALLRAKHVCNYMFMNSSPRHCTYCVPLIYICGYYYVQTTTLLNVKDIKDIYIQAIFVIEKEIGLGWK